MMNMNATTHDPNPGGLLHQWGRVIIRYAMVWVIPAVVITVLAGVYAIFRTPIWQVSQAMMVRNEAIGTEDGIGRFSHADQMKTVEETILEVAFSRDVLAQALKEVGPAPNYKGNLAAWPTAEDIDAFRGAIGLEAPAGAEFGTTEILYLTVKSESPERGIKLTNAMFEQLELQLRKIRNAKAKSVVAELVRATELARENLNESTGRLATIEKSVGADLNELRMMNHLGGNESTLEKTIVTIRDELRNAKINLQESETLITLLENAQNDTQQLLATPNRLLESQPALRALKNGLITAQLKTAEMQGRMLDTHPQVEAALEAERATKESLHRELKTAILGLRNDVLHEKNRISLLEKQRDENVDRLKKLATLRTSYSNLVEENENRSELLQKADEQLARVRAHQETTLAINLIEPIGTPDPGARPIGPRRSMILIAGMFGGLLVGFGILLLVVPVGTLMATAHNEPIPTVKEAVLGREPKQNEFDDDSVEKPEKEIPEDELDDESLIESRLEEVARLARVRTHRGLHPQSPG